MLALACAFVVGVASLEHEPTLPDPMWCASLPIAVWLALARVRASLLLAVVAGYTWAAFLAHVQVAGALPAAVETRDVEITGTVRGLPQVDSRRVRFDFIVAHGDHSPIAAGGRMRLSWYGARAVPAPGTLWRLTVRLRRPRGWHNPGGSDYEGRLFADGVIAVGYVTSGRRIGSSAALAPAQVDALRSRMSRSIRSMLDGYGSEGLVRALAIGDRSGVSQRDWQTLRVTGIAHLMAISGLHIGMAAGAAYWVASRAWTLLPRAALAVAAPQVAGVAAILAALGYALLAGFALPTQRALVMLAVVFGSRLWRRRMLPSHALALALVAVLAIDPHSVRSPGFWLSFVAVAVIVAALATRPAGNVRTLGGKLRTLGTVQIAVTVGLAPVTLSVFAEQSLVSPLVNAVVIPLVGTIVVPAILTGLLAGTVLPSVCAALLGAAAAVLDMLWPVLEWIGTHAAVLRAPAAIGWWQLAAGSVGVLILISPRGLLIRWLGIVWMLPLIAMRAGPAVGPGSYRMTVLDVGHGLAVVVETTRRVLVYDAGPRVGGRLDAAALALLPYLSSRGHDAIDRVVLSHGDSDHTGGYPRLAESTAVLSLVANGPVGTHRPDSECIEGLRWAWDGVLFEVLYPYEGGGGFDNAHSCVIRIGGSGGTTLLTGDIEKAAERALVTRLADRLAADVLVVPHHGSATSSTQGFVDAVSPSIALFSAALHGRYDLPDPAVQSRYADAGVATFSTSRCGAVTVEFPAHGEPRIARLEREARRRYWHQAYGPACRGGVSSSRGLRTLSRNVAESRRPPTPSFASRVSRSSRHGMIGGPHRLHSE